MQRTVILLIWLASTLTLAACEGTPFHDDVIAQARETACLNFGEASARNITAMAANRRDLYAPRRETPADAARRDRMISSYRTGDATAQTPQTVNTGTKP